MKSALVVLGIVLLGAALATVRTPPIVTPTTSRGPRVVGRQWAQGVRRELLALLDAWEVHGTHDVMIPGPADLRSFSGPPAGLRTGPEAEAAQAEAYRVGLTNARTLAETPHGAGAALDVWPVGFDPRVPWEQQPGLVQSQFTAFGLFAEARGFVWGGRWRSAKFPNGDQPHVQVKNWEVA